jgi:NAD(P)-dependent dehydrogenase (short-subunit alcohol dehydrogenase family)
MSGLLKGQVTLVTGAASGIGAAMARVFTAEGARAVLLDIDARRGVALARELEEDGAEAWFACADVSDPASVAIAVEGAIERYQSLDVVVNNAAVFTRAPIEELTYDDWRRVIGVNLDGTFHVVKAVLPHLRRQRRGKIFNVASGLGITGGRRAAAYATSKAAIIGFTKCLAHELAPYNIAANVVVPGLTDTEMPRRGQSDDDIAAMVARIPWGRLASPDEVARFVALLASPACDYVTGQTLPVNGGWIMP